MGRSRSPRRQDEEWISRQVASFGRRPDKRPKGLKVDQDGNMWLDQLMSTWARGEGMNEKHVLAAVKEHMFHEDGVLRFSINADPHGRIKIRVMPKRNKWAGDGGSTASWKGSAPRNPFARGTSDKTAVPVKGGTWVWQDDPWSRSSRSGPKMPAASSTAPQSDGASSGEKVLNIAKKIDMALDDVISDERAASADANFAQASSAFAAGARQPRQFRQPAPKHGGRGRARGERGPRGSGGKGGGKGSQRGRSASPEPMRGRRRSISESPSPAPGDDDEELAERMRVGATLDSSEGGQRKPNPPPGDNWTEYQDTDVSTTETVRWWYYEGPCGKWWCTEETKENPQQFDADEED